MSDKFKDTVQYLRNHLNFGEVHVRSSHAHQVVAAFLGYNSKKALIDDELEIDHDEFFLEVEPDLEKIEQSIQRMKGSDLSKVSISNIVDTIQVGLSPHCEACGYKRFDIQGITSTDDFDEADGWVCESCSEDMPDDYAHCVFCGKDVIYRADQINHNGECPEHNGESDMDEEEEQGWQDYLDYINK